MYLNMTLDSANDNDSCYSIGIADLTLSIHQLSYVGNLLGKSIHRHLLAVIYKWA